MENKIRELDIRYTELSKYLNISRPTLYKYIEDFNKRSYSKIDYHVLDVLKFIKKKTTVTKLQVIDYIIKQKNISSNDDLMEKIKPLVDNNKKAYYLEKMIELLSLDDYEEVMNNIIKKYIGGKKNDY